MLQRPTECRDTARGPPAFPWGITRDGGDVLVGQRLLRSRAAQLRNRQQAAQEDEQPPSPALCAVLRPDLAAKKLP